MITDCREGLLPSCAVVIELRTGRASSSSQRGKGSVFLLRRPRVLRWREIGFGAEEPESELLAGMRLAEGHGTLVVRDSGNPG